MSLSSTTALSPAVATGTPSDPRIDSLKVPHVGDIEGARKLLHDFLSDARALQVLLGGVELGETALRTSFGDEDLILGHVSSRRVMLGMSDAP